LDKVKVLGAGGNWKWALKAVGYEMGKKFQYERVRNGSRLSSTAK
jgi:hypothetical protein